MPHAPLASHDATRFPCRVARIGELADEREFLAACVDLERQRRQCPERAAMGFVVRIPMPLGASHFATGLHGFAPGATRPEALALGRHSACDVRGIPGASLRHALLLGSPDPAGGPPQLEAIDLSTEHGLTRADGSATRALGATGALLCGVGQAEVLLVGAAAGEPLFPGSVAAVCARARAGAAASAEGVLPGGGLVWPRAPRHDEDLRERTLAGSLVLHTRGAAWPVARTGPLLCVEAGWDELQRGLLLGRYPRCVGHRALGDALGVSRVHALLLVRAPRIYAIDAGSTHGTTLRGAAGARVRLGPGQRVGELQPSDELWLDEARVRVEVH